MSLSKTWKVFGQICFVRVEWSYVLHFKLCNSAKWTDYTRKPRSTCINTLKLYRSETSALVSVAKVIVNIFVFI